MSGQPFLPETAGKSGVQCFVLHRDGRCVRVVNADITTARGRCSAMNTSILQVSRLCATSGSKCSSSGRLQRTYRPGRFTTRVRAANNAKTEASVDVERLGVIPFDDDRETLMDALAFTGPAPERTNGRIAMIAFVGAAAAELATGKSVLEQATASPALITFMTLLLTAAGFMPKIASGVSLSRLLDAAGREGLPKELSFFNKTHEIWLGRVAMLGFTGLLGVEVWKGGALF